MTDVNHAIRKHARCGASNADRWLNCPGSVALSSTLPEQEATSYALEGTRAHELSEKILFHWQKNNYELDFAYHEQLKSKLSEDDHEMYDNVMQYVEHCIEEVHAFDATPTIRIEQRLTLSADMDMFGTADFLATGLIGGEPCGVIVDLKYGKGKKVKTQDNPQLAYYAVALKLTSKKKLTKVKVSIVQPRVADPIGSQWFGTQELQEWESKFTFGAENALWMLGGGRKPVYQEGSWCWFCPGKKICPLIAERLSTKLIEEFPDDL